MESKQHTQRNSSKRFLTIPEAARRLQCSRTELYRAIKAEVTPFPVHYFESTGLVCGDHSKPFIMARDLENIRSKPKSWFGLGEKSEDYTLGHWVVVTGYDGHVGVQYFQIERRKQAYLKKKRLGDHLTEVV